MNETLRLALKSSGWGPGTHRGFLQTSRAGIIFAVGPARGATDGRMELRYRYHTETTHAEGEVALPPDADMARIGDAMTTVYQRVHERPDFARVFGGGKRRGMPQPPAPKPDDGAQTVPAPFHDPPPISAEEAGQGSLEL